MGGVRPGPQRLGRPLYAGVTNLRGRALSRYEDRCRIRPQNVLCLGSEIVGGELAAELVRAFVQARFVGGERYVRRLKKVEALECRAA
jgi:Ribose/Galactose Isomerase